MEDQRTYSEKEIAEIFERASKDQELVRQQQNENSGLSLDDLKEIGRQTGIDPELITRAAATVDHFDDQPAPPPPSTLLGFQTSVSRIVNLRGRLSDDSWARLVVEMREIFHAHGKLEQQGGIRSWRNGNLRITVESTESGDRLRMTTKKGNALALIFGNMMALAMMLGLLAVTFLLDGSSGGFISLRILIPLLVAAGMGIGLLQLPRWVSLRGEQMDALGIMASELVKKGELRELASRRTTVQETLDVATDEYDSVDAQNRGSNEKSGRSKGHS